VSEIRDENTSRFPDVCARYELCESHALSDSAQSVDCANVSPLRAQVSVLGSISESAADTHLLTTILHVATGASDPRPLAEKAIGRFGSFGATSAAAPHELLAVSGFATDAMVLVKLLRHAAQQLLRSKIMNVPLGANRGQLIVYLESLLSREPVEQCRILYMDTAGRLMREEAHSTGTVNHAPVYPREIVRKARELGAGQLILVHNHPSGDPTPSAEDLSMTSQVCDAARLFGIRVLDHVIVGHGRSISFAAAGLIESP